MSGSGVKRGEEVRVSPAALLRTGYPARKSHLSLSLALSLKSPQRAEWRAEV